MCGFIGAVGGGNPKPDLRRGLRFLEGRGPDSQRVWSSADGRVSMLHARLSIVDFDDRASQPMCDASGQVAVAFVGEIYNYREMREETAEYAYRTESDTEVILAAYLAHGVEAFRRFRGMFIVAIADARRRRVILLRDPVGKKPLFVGRVRGATLFGSTIGAMLAAAGQAGEIDPEGMADYARDGWVQPIRCLVKGFKPLIPGEVIEMDWEGREVGRSDCRPACPEGMVTCDSGAIKEEVSVLLRRAFERRLAHIPVPTALLSGGIDSTVVTAGIQGICRERGLPLQVLTLGSVVPWRNDEPYARYAARRLGIPLEILTVPKRGLADRVLAALDAQDEPLGMVAYFTLFELVRAAKEYGRILITGDGGDEVFLGYGVAKDWVRDEGEGSKGAEGCSRAGNGLAGPASAQRPTLMSSPARTPFSAGEIPCGPPLPEWMSEKGRGTVTAQLVGHMFAKADRASAEQGVEIRCPLLDWDLMCYARRISPEVLLAGGTMKALLKAQLVGWPRWFLERPKVGLAFNMRYLWGLSNFKGLRESVLPDAQAALGEAVPPPIRRPADQWSGLDIFRNFESAWRLLALSRFLKRLRSVA